MFSLMFRKLIHKKWMVACLLIGNILLIAVASSYPLYRVSSFQRMLIDEFEDYTSTNGKWPAIFSVNYNTLKGGAKIGFTTMENEADKAFEELPMEAFEVNKWYYLMTQKAESQVVRDGNTDKRITLGAIENMGEKVELVYGRAPENSLDSEGCMEVWVSDEAMLSQDILVDDVYTFDIAKYADGAPVKLKVVGVFRPIDEDDYFWQPVGGDLNNQVFAAADIFKNSFLDDEIVGEHSLRASWNYIWDYRLIDISEVSSIIYKAARYEKNDLLGGKCYYEASLDILKEYSNKAKRIEATLLILQVPVLLLLCAFLYMIAGQMLQMERNEISLLRSRGASKGQVLGLYFSQSVFLSLVSLIGGVPLGMGFCKLLGTATAFLEFSAKRSLNVRFTTDVYLYAMLAVALSIVMTTIPVIGFSGLSIVNLKQSRSRQKKSFWKKIYLDYILLAISVYGYYSFNRNANQMVLNVLTGESLDPLLYISFSLFILGAGLFCARLQPLVLKLFFSITKKNLKPSTYASLLGTIRTGAKQEFIILFMILTVSIGISDTVIARTIVNNAINNTRHIVGTDLVVKEKWISNKAAVERDPSLKLSYMEPDLNKYLNIDGVDNLTQVICTEVSAGAINTDVTLLGIKTKGFFEVTSMSDKLLPYSYADYLNVLASDSQAILVSENFMTKQGYKLGDVVSYKNSDGKTNVGYIYGFFTYWPSYNPSEYSLKDDGSVESKDNYMIVANFSYLQSKWGVYPYEIWLKSSDGGEGFYSWLKENDSIKFTKIIDMSEKENAITEDTLFQGTNGILSMSFIVILLLCVVGYLIYWIMSIKSRELLFGVLRAMGMRKSEINWLLIVEQICSGIFAIIAGGAIGVLSSNMFVPMIQQAYAASEQILPLELITKTQDMVQLFAVIGGVLLLCLVILARIVSKLNISSALKLGED